MTVRINPTPLVWAVIDVCTLRTYSSARAVAMEVLRVHKLIVSPKYVYQIECGIRGQRDIGTYGGGFGYCGSTPDCRHTFYPVGAKIDLGQTFEGTQGVIKCSEHTESRTDGLQGVCQLLEDATLSPTKKSLLYQARMFYQMGDNTLERARKAL
jgi:hypothetical protein